MWRWDQGHIPYCQFDVLRKFASAVCQYDFGSLSRQELSDLTGLGFTGPASHTPWRQYGRVMPLFMIATKQDDRVVPTSLAHVLAVPGNVTCDEYFHFFVQVFTDPSPAFQGWSAQANPRYPLLFCLKYLLAKCASGETEATSLDELIGAYEATTLSGDEDQTAFLKLLQRSGDFAQSRVRESRRQAKESLQVISQIPYLYLAPQQLRVDLDPEDAVERFDSLHAISGARALQRSAEVMRLSNLFEEATADSFSYGNTVLTEVVESGFREGSKVKRTHVTIERSRLLREAYFRSNLTAICDLCSLDTAATFPWTSGILDLHHLLPLASGARVVTVDRVTSTTFDDLVPVCPSCHRAIHRFYDNWLSDKERRDFHDAFEAREAYAAVKQTFPGAIYA